MSAKSHSTDRQSLQTVQVLRGVAALLVLAYHTVEVARRKLGTVLTEVFHFGHAGVDFFFVLSGFIICYVHFADWERPERLKGYVPKRLIRVCPLYWAITGAIVLAALAGLSLAGETGLAFGRIITSFLLIPQAEKPILGVGWTLTHEMFFYALFSLLIWLPRRYAFPLLGSWLAAVTVRLFAHPADFPSVALQFVLNPHNLQFALGCGVGVMMVKGLRVPAMPFLLVGAVLFVGSGLADVFADFRLNTYLQYGISAALLLVGASVGDLHQSWKPPSWLVAIGAGSYSIYLVHLAALTLLATLAKRLNLPAKVGVGVTMWSFAGLALIFGMLTHYWLEKPLLDLGRRWLLRSKAQ